MKRLLLPVGLLLLPAASFAQAPDGAEIMRRTDKDHRSKDERGVVEMILVTDSGEKQARTLEICAKTGEGEDDMNLVRFLTPPTVRGTAVLTVEATGRADDQWLYLPAMKKSKRLASGDKTQRFAGTDFTYEDLRTENLSGFDYQRTGEEKLGDFQCWIVEARPKQGTQSGYSLRKLWVDKDRFLIHKIEYYDPKGALLKTLENKGFEQVSGLWRAKGAIMKDVQRKSETRWRFSEREINPGLPESTFSVAQLERGL